jgi:dynein heavy chain
VKKERAAKLLNGLGGERQKWLVCNRMIDKRFVTIQGDVLLGAAFITYLSGFTQKFREMSVENWGSIIKLHGIAISDDFSFNKTFGDQIKIKEWMFNGLPGDSFSI